MAVQDDPSASFRDLIGYLREDQRASKREILDAIADVDRRLGSQIETVHARVSTVRSEIGASVSAVAERVDLLEKSRDEASWPRAMLKTAIAAVIAALVALGFAPGHASPAPGPQPAPSITRQAP